MGGGVVGPKLPLLSILDVDMTMERRAGRTNVQSARFFIYRYMTGVGPRVPVSRLPRMGAQMDGLLIVRGPTKYPPLASYMARATLTGWWLSPSATWITLTSRDGVSA